MSMQAGPLSPAPSAGPWDDAVLQMHGWCQVQLQIPALCPSGDNLGLVLADQGEVGVVIDSLLDHSDMFHPEDVKVGDRVTHVNNLRVRTREDLLATIDMELGASGGADSVPAPAAAAAAPVSDSGKSSRKEVILTVIRKADGDEEALPTTEAAAATTATTSFSSPLATRRREDLGTTAGGDNADEKKGGADGDDDGDGSSKKQQNPLSQDHDNAVETVAEAESEAGGILSERKESGRGHQQDDDDDDDDASGGGGEGCVEGIAATEAVLKDGRGDLVVAAATAAASTAANNDTNEAAASARVVGKGGEDEDDNDNSGGDDEKEVGVAARVEEEEGEPKVGEGDNADDGSVNRAASGGDASGAVDLLSYYGAAQKEGRSSSTDEDDDDDDDDDDEKEGQLTVDDTDGAATSNDAAAADGGAVASLTAVLSEADAGLFGEAAAAAGSSVDRAATPASASDFSSPSAAAPLTQGVWACGVCTLENASTANFCDACEAPRPLLEGVYDDDDGGEAGGGEAASGPHRSVPRRGKGNSGGGGGGGGDEEDEDDDDDNDGRLRDAPASKEGKAAAAAKRLAARQAAYQDELYAHVPESMAPVGGATQGSCGGGGGDDVGDDDGGDGDRVRKELAEDAVTQHLQQLIPVVNKLQDVFNAFSSASNLHSVSFSSSSSSSSSSSRLRRRGSQHQGHGGSGGGGGDEDDDDDDDSTFLGLDLPQIVVIGAQSSGKSSVVEALVGRSFLPRGTGIVTRRPLVLQLQHTPGSKEWVEFLHLPGRKFGDYECVRTEIGRATEELCGANKAVAPQPITLRLFSPTVTNLTLVDLPGMTKMAVGDQPQDIEHLIRSLTLKFVRNPKAIILAVLPATEDVANSEALKVAREVDSQRQRTLGVITKVDLMDQGTDCVPVLANRFLPLKLGYVAVVNRGELANKRGDSVAAGFNREESFFASHPQYRVHMSRCTSKRLAKLLNAVLVRHIHDSLPELKQRIADKIYTVEQQLDSLGDPVSELPVHRKGKLLLTLLTDYAQLFTGTVNGEPGAMLRAKSSMSSLSSSRGGSDTAEGGGGYVWKDGKYERTASGASSGGAAASGGGGERGRQHHQQRQQQQQRHEDSSELTGGARIQYILDDLFCETMRGVNPFDATSDADICMAISNANGHQPCLFVPELSFHQLVKKQISRLERPALETVEAVKMEMAKLAKHCADSSQLARFPALHDKVTDAVGALLEKGLQEGKGMVLRLVAVELAWLNTSHPNFIGGSRAVLQAMTRLQEEKEKERERLALMRARTMGVFGNKEVESVLEGQAQGYTAPAVELTPSPSEAADPRSFNAHGRSKSGWRFWRRNSSRAGGKDGDEDEDEDEDEEGQQGDEDDDSSGGGGGGAAAAAAAPKSGPRSAKARRTAVAASSTTTTSSSSSSKASSRRDAGGDHDGGGARANGRGMGYEAKRRVGDNGGGGGGGGCYSDAFAVNLRKMPDKVRRDYSVKSEKETIEVETVKKLVLSYFNVVRKQMMDYVPKTAMAFLVKGLVEDLQGELVSRLYSDASVEEMTTEDPSTADERTRLRAAREAFVEALQVLNDVRLLG